MATLKELLTQTGIAVALASAEAAAIADEIGQASGLSVYPASLTAVDGLLVFIARENSEKIVGVIGNAEGFTGESVAVAGDAFPLILCDRNAATAATLRAKLPHLKAKLAGLDTSAGTGDRLGIATPGHVLAFQRKGSGVVPFLAQQSIREMERTGRDPQGVMDDALFGVLESGWRDGFGSDADHLKTPADATLCAKAGFTMFTVDPGEYVDDAADTEALPVLAEKFAALPWDMLEDSAEDCRKRYAAPITVEGLPDALTVTEEQLVRAAAKYGRAIVHTLTMYRHIDKVTGGAFELEMSVDETNSPTSVAEHLYVARELQRLGVKVVSLAPRFVGRFEKGVDYIGDVAVFESELARHAAIARQFGPYKLSIHSGSDKFSIYPLVAKYTDGLVHLKTAGTSYLEALRAIATAEPVLFREILDFSCDRYETDKASYHVSAELAKVPDSEDLSDEQLPDLLEDFDTRQVLHVTYGSVLTEKDSNFYWRLLAALDTHETLHYETLAGHLGRHLEPFAK